MILSALSAHVRARRGHVRPLPGPLGPDKRTTGGRQKAELQVMEIYDRDLIDALCRYVIGKPAAVSDWRDLLRVRDVIDELLNGAINRAQHDPQDRGVHVPGRCDGHGRIGTPESKAGESPSFERGGSDPRPAPRTCPASPAPRGDAGQHHRPQSNEGDR